MASTPLVSINQTSAVLKDGFIEVTVRSPSTRSPRKMVQQSSARPLFSANPAVAATAVLRTDDSVLHVSRGGSSATLWPEESRSPWDSARAWRRSGVEPAGNTAPRPRDEFQVSVQYDTPSRNFSTHALSHIDAEELTARSEQIKQDVLELDQLKRDIASLSSPERVSPPRRYSPPMAPPSSSAGSATRRRAALERDADVATTWDVPRASDPVRFADLPTRPRAVDHGESPPPPPPPLDEEDFDEPVQPRAPRAPSPQPEPDYVDSPIAFTAATTPGRPLDREPLLDGLVRDLDRFKYAPKLRMSLSKRPAAPLVAVVGGAPTQQPQTPQQPAPPPPVEYLAPPPTTDFAPDDLALAARALTAPLTVLHEISSTRRQANAPAPPSNVAGASAAGANAIDALRREHDAEVAYLRQQLVLAQQRAATAASAQTTKSPPASLRKTASLTSMRSVAGSKLSAWEAMLRRGALFVKVTTRGSQHEKFVYSDGTRLLWRNAVGQGDERALALQRIERVVPGQVTRAFRARNRAGGEDRCFSVVTDDRTLDLEVVAGALKPAQVRDEWVEAIKAAAVKAGAKLQA